jgi:hypothetical protein
MTTPLSLRFTYICGRYGRLLVASLVLVSAIGLASAAASATAPPEQRRVAEQSDQQTVATTLESTATVTGPTSLYETGETLENKPVYLMAATPNVTLSAVTVVPTEEPVTVNQTVTLELAALRNAEVFWTERRTIANESKQVTDGQLETTGTLDVRSLTRERLAAVDAEASDVGRIQARVLVNTSYDTGVYEGQTNVSTPLEITDSAYELDTPQTVQESHARQVTRTVNASAGGSEIAIAGSSLTVPNGVVPRGGVGVLALAAAALVWLTGRRIDDFETFRQRYEAVRYSEWISRGKIPETDSYARVPIETLVDLVDIAIDSEKRVIYDDSREVYAVVDGNLVYEFWEEDVPERWYEFGLAPLDDSTLIPEPDFGQGEQAVPDGGVDTEEQE